MLPEFPPRNILITGAAKRIGAACAQLLHSEGCNIVLHYHTSEMQALQLCEELNQQRANSAYPIGADLLSVNALQTLAIEACAVWGGIDALINNASLFYPQPFAEVTEKNWDDIFNCHVKSPFFLAQALHESLAKKRGCIINLIDIHAERGLKGYPVYSIAKAGLAAMTRILAKELAPAVRVNGISPGAILWPEMANDLQNKTDILQKIALQRLGEPEDIAQTALFLLNNPYITGQIITVDGGRTLFC